MKLFLITILSAVLFSEASVERLECYVTSDICKNNPECQAHVEAIVIDFVENQFDNFRYHAERPGGATLIEKNPPKGSRELTDCSPCFPCTKSTNTCILMCSGTCWRRRLSEPDELITPEKRNNDENKLNAALRANMPKEFDLRNDFPQAQCQLA